MMSRPRVDNPKKQFSLRVPEDTYSQDIQSLIDIFVNLNIDIKESNHKNICDLLKSKI
jgi:hypothetical protein